MTVSSQVNRKDYSGNGSTTAFATEFRFLEDSHLRVILTVDLTGVETVQSITTNYTVTGKGEDSGGTVTMIIAPATGETLTIKRNVPVTQQTDYVENDDFPAESHERALDKLTMIVQEQQEELDRSLKLSEGQQSSGLTIPAPDEGKFLQWDASGNFINIDIATLGSVSLTTFGQTLINSINAAAGRLVMGSAKKIASAVTDNLASFDSNDEAKDSGLSVADVASALTTNNLFHMQDQRPSGTDGGSFNSGDWRTRALSTELTNNISGASLNSGTAEISLPAGDYFSTAEGQAKQVGAALMRLFDTSNTVVLLSGFSDLFSSGEVSSGTSRVSGSFSLGAATVIKLQHQCDTTKATTGFGKSVGSAFTVEHETYVDIKIWKVG